MSGSLKNHLILNCSFRILLPNTSATLDLSSDFSLMLPTEYVCPGKCLNLRVKFHFSKVTLKVLMKWGTETRHNLFCLSSYSALLHYSCKIREWNILTQCTKDKVFVLDPLLLYDLISISKVFGFKFFSRNGFYIFWKETWAKEDTPI